MNSANSPQGPSPLVPQGSMLDHRSSSRSRVKLAFYCVVGVHVAGLLVLLMQGCKREPTAPPGDLSQVQPAYTNTVPVDYGTTTGATGAPPVEPVSPIASNPPPPEPVIPPTPPTPPTPAVGASEYVVKKGDSFYTIAKEHHVTQKAIQDANPGVNPLKLQLGQKLNIPAPTAPTTATPTGNTPTATEPGDHVYVVKSGDVLEKIAKNNGTTVKAIMQLNSLPDTKIKVGQKLKLPAKAAPALPNP